MITCTACGFDAVDQHYGIGFDPDVTEYSPFPRVNKLRRDCFEQQCYLDSQRVLLYTEAYKKYEAYPLVIKCSRALENCLLNFELHYYEDELFFGDLGGGNHVGQVYQEFSFNWMCDELKHKPLYEREFSKVLYDDKVRDEILSCEDYWKGKTIAEGIEARMDYDAKKGSNMGKIVYFMNLYQYFGIGHTTPDMPNLMKLGFGGIKKQVEKQLAKDDITTAEGLAKHDFHTGQLIVLNAASEYCRRYAAYGKAIAGKPEYAKNSSEILRMSENCAWIAENPPRDIWEALQLYHMVHQIILIESNGHSVSFGRVDQYLYPFYEEDMKKGTFTKAFIQELLEVHWLKSQTMLKIRDGQTGMANRGGDRGWGGTAIVLGGMDKDGKDVTNDLTFMFLDALIHLRTPSPWPMVRMHKGTPHELKIKLAEVIRTGIGHPKLFNDDTAIDACLRKGATLEEARDYSIVGCVELEIPGYEYGWHDSVYFSIAKVMELSLNNGQCCNCSERCPLYKGCAGAGRQLGIRTGSLKDFQTFEELKEAYLKQLHYWADLMVESVEIMDMVHQERKALPFLSSFINDCTEKGLDISRGGARYNGNGPQCNGLGTAADSLTALKQIVFDEKKATGEEFLNAIKNNWNGYETLYALVNSQKVHHYGNDDDYADEIAQFLFNSYCAEIEGRSNARGGKYDPGVYTVTSNVLFGMILGATPDGRKAMEPLSDNLGPVHTLGGSHDYCGPTALANSLGKLDHARATNGTLVNMKFSAETVSGDAGRENFINFIDSYMEKKPMHIQVMITDPHTLRDAQKTPEKYTDLLVRVSGTSAFFVQLGENLQNDLINRTEHSFE